MRARYYDPTTGRFISEDPVKDGLNWYVYCANDPVNFWDPSGLEICLKGTDEEKQASFNELASLTDDELDYNRETGEVTIVNRRADEDISRSVGTNLVRELLESSNIVQITRNAYRSTGKKLATETLPPKTIRKEDENGKKQRIKIVQVNISDETNNQTDRYLVEQDSNGVAILTSYADTPKFIFLGHELIHAQHHFTDSFVSFSGGYRYFTLGGKEYIDRMDRPGVNDEFYTVGFNYISSNELDYPNRPVFMRVNGYSENALRAENHLNLRAAYRDDLTP